MKLTAVEIIKDMNETIQKLNEQGYRVSAVGQFGGCTYVDKIYITKKGNM